MPANEPMKLSQSGTSSPKRFPTRAPRKSSISATEKPTSTEIIEATRIVAARTAAIAMLLISTSGEANVRGRGHQLPWERLGASLIALAAHAL